MFTIFQFYNMDAKAVQTNSIAREPFQTQNKKTIEAKISNFSNIIMNQMQSQKYQNKEISKKHYQDEENRSINTNENQLIEFSQEHQEKFTQVKNPCIAPYSSENLGNWSRNTTLILGDSRRISKRDS